MSRKKRLRQARTIFATLAKNARKKVRKHCESNNKLAGITSDKLSPERARKFSHHSALTLPPPPLLLLLLLLLALQLARPALSLAAKLEGEQSDLLAPRASIAQEPLKLAGPTSGRAPGASLDDGLEEGGGANQLAPTKLQANSSAVWTNSTAQLSVGSGGGAGLSEEDDRASTIGLQQEVLELSAFEAAKRGYFRHSTLTSVILTIAYSMVFVIGIIGNSFVVAIVCKSPRMRTVTNYFIANLAFADILVLLFCLPATLVGNLFIPYVLGLFICKTVSYLQGVAVSASINTMVIVTMDKFLAIYFPMYWHMSRNTARWVIACIWLFSGCISAPWAIFFTLLPYPIPYNGELYLMQMCAEDWPSEQWDTLYFVCANLILLYLLPGTLIILCYLGIWYKIECRKIPGDRPKSVNIELIMQRSKLKVVKMMVVVVVIFLLSWLPLYLIFARIKLFSERPQWEDKLITKMMPLAQWLGASNSCINPILYTFFNRKYKRGLADLLRFALCCGPSGPGGQAPNAAERGQPALGGGGQRTTASTLTGTNGANHTHTNGPAANGGRALKEPGPDNGAQLRLQQQRRRRQLADGFAGRQHTGGCAPPVACAAKPAELLAFERRADARFLLANGEANLGPSSGAHRATCSLGACCRLDEQSRRRWRRQQQQQQQHHLRQLAGECRLCASRMGAKSATASGAGPQFELGPRGALGELRAACGRARARRPPDSSCRWRGRCAHTNCRRSGHLCACRAPAPDAREAAAAAAATTKAARSSDEMDDESTPSTASQVRRSSDGPTRAGARKPAEGGANCRASIDDAQAALAQRRLQQAGGSSCTDNSAEATAGSGSAQTTRSAQVGGRQQQQRTLPCKGPRFNRKSEGDQVEPDQGAAWASAAKRGNGRREEEAEEAAKRAASDEIKRLGRPQQQRPASHCRPRSALCYCNQLCADHHEQRDKHLASQRRLSGELAGAGQRRRSGSSRAPVECSHDSKRRGSLEAGGQLKLEANKSVEEAAAAAAAKNVEEDRLLFGSDGETEAESALEMNPLAATCGSLDQMRPGSGGGGGHSTVACAGDHSSGCERGQRNHHHRRYHDNDYNHQNHHRHRRHHHHHHHHHHNHHHHPHLHPRHHHHHHHLHEHDNQQPSGSGNHSGHRQSKLVPPKQERQLRPPAGETKCECQLEWPAPVQVAPAEQTDELLASWQRRRRRARRSREPSESGEPAQNGAPLGEEVAREREEKEEEGGELGRPKEDQDERPK